MVFRFLRSVLRKVTHFRQLFTSKATICVKKPWSLCGLLVWPGVRQSAYSCTVHTKPVLGLQRQHGHEGHTLLLQRTLVCFPAPMLASSQGTALKDLLPSSWPPRDPAFMSTNSHTHAQLKVKSSAHTVRGSVPSTFLPYPQNTEITHFQ